MVVSWKWKNYWDFANLEQVDRLSAMNDILCNIYMIIKNHFMKYKQKITWNHVTYYLLHLLIPEKRCLIQDFLKMSAVNRSTSNSYVFHQQVNSHCTSQEVETCPDKNSSYQISVSFFFKNHKICFTAMHKWWKLNKKTCVKYMKLQWLNTVCNTRAFMIFPRFQ